VRIDASGTELASEATTGSDDDPAGAEAVDTDVLAVFRGGFEATDVLDGEDPGATDAPSWTIGSVPLRVLIAEAWASSGLVDTMLVASAIDGSGFRIERLNAGDTRLRLVATDRSGRERAGTWQVVAPGSEFDLDVEDAGDGTREVRANGGTWTLALAFDSTPGVDGYEVWIAGED
jgi:hypothetical protein